MPPTTNAIETSMVAGPPSLPDANPEETGQGTAEVTEGAATESEAVAAGAETPAQESEGASDAAAGEEQAATEGEGEAETAEAAGEATEDAAGYPEWLPWEPMKQYPDELLQLAAKKFGISPELIGQPGVKELLSGNITAQIQARDAELAAQPDEGAEAEAAEGKEEGAAEGEEGAEVERLTVPQLHEVAMEIAAEHVTPEGANLYATGLKTAMDALYDAHQSGDKEAIATAEQQVTKTNMAFLTMALRELIPLMVPPVITKHLQSFSTNMQQTRQAHTEAVTRLSKDPRYASVAQFVKSGDLQAVLQQYPELGRKQFFKPGQNGKRVPLSPVENRMEQYKAAMALHRGAKNPPAPVLVKKAMAAGQKQADQMQNRKELGKLAAGRATGKTPTGQQGQETREEYIGRMKGAAAMEDPLSQPSARAKRA